MSLYRKDAKTLGFLPVGAFEENASKRQVLIARTTQDSCAGYLLFRVAKGKAAIVHLCVSESHRQKGIARALVERLCAETKHLAGIGLHCRRDYDSNGMWPRFGFVARHTKHGRGQDEAELTYWWLDHNHPDLFSLSLAGEDRTPVVIDANVFLDIHQRDTPDSEDSKALLSAWLQDSIELCLTNEIYNDLHRATDTSVRRRSNAFVTKYRVLRTDATKVQKLAEELGSVLPKAASLRDESDIRHLAHAIAASARYFVTRDAELAERSDVLYEQYGLSVLHPAALINQLDSLEREEEYRPARLAGTSLRENLLKAEALPAIATACHVSNEKASDLEKVLNHFLAKPEQFVCRVCSTAEGQPLVISVIANDKAQCQLALLRLSRESLAATVARHVLRSLVDVKSRENALTLAILDPRISPVLIPGLLQCGFIYAEGAWLKFLGQGVRSVAELRSRVAEWVKNESNFGIGQKMIEVLDGYPSTPAAAAQLEHLFWPAKIDNAPLPTYIVPIQPRWAQHFFDVELGSQLLIGLRTELHLGTECVYYRSPHGPEIVAPGRILWYVSQGADKEGAMAVKACSRLEEVLVAKAKELFRRFRRLGVYERRDVINCAGGSPDGKVMALRFTLTERFKSPVSLQWLNDNGIKGNFPGPREISCDEFSLIYKKGTAV